MSPRFPALLAVSLTTLAPAGLRGADPAATTAFTATEMMRLRRLADPQASPDGKQVAYALTEIDLAGAKAQHRPLAPAPLGGEPRRLTSNPASDSRPRWSPDGRRIAFLSTRDGGPQVWVLDLSGASRARRPRSRRASTPSVGSTTASSSW